MIRHHPPEIPNKNNKLLYFLRARDVARISRRAWRRQTDIDTSESAPVLDEHAAHTLLADGFVYNCACFRDDIQGVFMKFLFAALFAFSVLAAGNATASEKLAQSSGCMTCHTVERKVIGPSYKEIAAKYRNDKSAEANMVKKVKSGGSGVWGPTPMPPNAHVKEDDIKAIVAWILALK
jgi:cytochrome c